MLKKLCSLVCLCILIMMTSRSARAFFIGIAEETGGTAYEWYVPGIPIYWAYNDGYMPAQPFNGTPYVKFKGNDASPNGHCLELALAPPGPDYLSPGYIEVYVYYNGSYTSVATANLEDSPYSKLRLWVNHNAGGSGTSLDWALYLVAPDRDRAAQLSITRLEVNKSTCITPPQMSLGCLSRDRRHPIHSRTASFTNL